MNAPVSTVNAPPLRIVGRYLLTAVFFFVALCLYLLLAWDDIHGHFFQPRLLALTHIATLGWITMTIFGAMFQLVPVVLSVPLWSVRLAAVQYWIWLCGVLTLVIGFWAFAIGPVLDVAAVLLVTGGLLFLWNMLRTLARVERWDLTGYFLVAALAYFFVTITLGGTLAFNLGHAFISRSHIDYLEIHAHFGLVGWVAMVIMGVAFRLIPMFAIAHDYSARPAWIAFWCVNAGLLGTMVERTFGPTPVLSMFYATLLLAGLCAYVVQIAIMLRMRLRRSMDIAMRHAIVAFVMMLVAASLGFVAAFGALDRATYERVTLAYGMAALLGFMSALIIGELYKIVPFLVWYARYAHRAGLEPVPALKDMVHEPLARGAFWIFVTGVITAIAAVIAGVQPLFAAGAGLLFLASLMIAYNIARVFQQ